MSDNFDIMKNMRKDSEDEEIFSNPDNETQEDITPDKVKNEENLETKGFINYIIENKSYIQYFILVFLIFTILILLTFKYKLTATDNNVYRINQITGDVQLIKGSRFVHIDKISESDKLGLSKLTKLKEIVIPKHKIRCNLEVLWRDDQLYYNFTASPYDGKLKKIREGSYFESLNAGFKILLYDKDGFVLAEIPVKIDEMTGNIDGKGKTIELQEKGSIGLSYSDMKLINNWSSIWNF